MRYPLSFLSIKKALWPGALASGAVLLSALGASYAQTAPSATDERARIRHERQAIDQTLSQAQAACYQRFAVEDCLRQARQTARTAHTDLRQQEAVLNEAQRRQRAAGRLADIAQRQRNHPVPVPIAPRLTEAPRTEAAKSTTERDQQARQRARQQQQKRQAHQASQAEAVSAQAAKAAHARQQRETKNAAAAQRRARRLQSQADAGARRVPAAPLSPAP